MPNKFRGWGSRFLATLLTSFNDFHACPEGRGEKLVADCQIWTEIPRIRSDRGIYFYKILPGFKLCKMLWCRRAGLGEFVEMYNIKPGEEYITLRSFFSYIEKIHCLYGFTKKSWPFVNQ